MSWDQVLLLSLIQGLTEFLPVSSSAHLALLPALTAFPDQGLSFDVATHVGTLAAVALYFRKRLAAMGRDFCRSLASQRPAADGRLAWQVLAATVPIALAGGLLHDVVETLLRSPVVIGAASVAFGVLLFVADRRRLGGRDEYSLGARGALLVGCAQALALLPGTSRSGITITAALFLGLDRGSAARFSFLLSIPAIALAGGYEAWRLWAAGPSSRWGDLLAGAAVSAGAAYLTIHFFLKLLDRLGLLPFVAYRIALGVALLLAAASGGLAPP